MKLKNIQLETMMNSLAPLLQRRDKIGYIAARNYRLFNNTLTEFFIFKNDLFKKYGTENKEDNTIFISQESIHFNEFIDELNTIAEIEHEVDFMTIPYNDVVGLLSGEEILDVDWMLTEAE